MEYKIFISYRREDKVFKDRIFEILSNYIDEKKIFVDKKDLYLMPNKWFETIKESLMSSEYIVICLDKSSYARNLDKDQKDWYYEEIDLALKRQKQEGKTRIVLAINNRPNFDKGKERDKELAELQDVCYNSSSQEEFKKHLLEIVAVDINVVPQRNTVINNITIPQNLITRRDLLDKLDKEFESHKCIVISGIGGSGKTSLAYLYAKEQNFDNKVLVTVNGTIEDALLEKMTALLYKEEDERKKFMQNADKQVKLEIIKHKLSDIQGNNLLILDINTNNEEVKHEIETQIHQYTPADNWKTLVLTRTNPINSNRFTTIKMEKMTDEDAKFLFTKNWSRTQIEFSQEQLSEITKELFHHPLLIEQTAMVFSKGHERTADEIIIKIKESSKIDNPRTKKIVSGLAVEGKEQQDIYTYLINLCNIEKLSADEIQFLACFVTWPNEPIDYEVIDALLPGTNDQLDSLEDKGILSRNNIDQYYIHSLLADVLREQININEFDYTEYFDNIQKFLADYEKRVNLHKYSKYIASSFINYGLCNDIILFRGFLNQLCNNNDVILYNLPEPEFTVIVNKLEENVEPFQVAELYNAVARAEEFKNNLSDAKSHYEMALGTLDGVEENEETLYLKGAFLSNLAMLEEDLGDTESAKKHYEESLEISRKLPETPLYLDRLATTLHNFASLEEKIGDTNSAKMHYEESLEINRELPETPQYLDSLATTLHNFASLEEKIGDNDSAKNIMKNRWKYPGNCRKRRSI